MARPPSKQTREDAAVLCALMAQVGDVDVFDFVCADYGLHVHSTAARLAYAALEQMWRTLPPAELKDIVNVWVEAEGLVRSGWVQGDKVELLPKQLELPFETDVIATPQVCLDKPVDVQQMTIDYDKIRKGGLKIVYEGPGDDEHVTEEPMTTDEDERERKATNAIIAIADEPDVDLFVLTPLNDDAPPVAAVEDAALEEAYAQGRERDAQIDWSEPGDYGSDS